LGGKHAPIELGKYIEIHETAMRGLERDRSVFSDDLAFESVEGGVLLEGRIHCAGGILIDVTKALAIRGGEGESAIVQTATYTYHAQVEGLGNLFRYCSPHDTEAQPDHNPFHHKHTYDLLAGDVVGNLTEVDAEERPTLAEVIREACAWYYENAEEVERRRSSAK
jgi:hypothetical protein